jgi:hypothetical protein
MYTFCLLIIIKTHKIQKKFNVTLFITLPKKKNSGYATAYEYVILFLTIITVLYFIYIM